MLFELGIMALIVGGYGLALALLEVAANWLERRNKR